MPDQTQRDFHNRRLSGLKLEADSFRSHYMEISDFISPRRGRFFADDVNRGEKRYQSIINSKAGWSLRVSRAGMLAGTANPTRPWIAFETMDRDLMEFQPVKLWLQKAITMALRIAARSNFYSEYSSTMKELLMFGTPAMTHVDDFQHVARFYNHTVGSFYIAQDDRRVVDTLYREYQLSTVQMVRQFGLDNVSMSVSDAYDRGHYERWHNVVHAIERNPDHNARNPLSRFKPFRSVYYELNGKGSRTRGPDDLYLARQGFDRFPAYVPRWETTDGDIYATDCPGMMALGDIKQLQHEERRKGQGIDKMVDPVLTGPASLRSKRLQNLPGGTILAGEDNATNTVRAAYEVRLPLQELRQDITEVERRIEEAFLVDMFLAITNIEGIQPRNQEDLLLRNEERLLQIGPVLEHLHGEFLAKWVDRIFDQMIAADILPPAPQELQGHPLHVVFISNLALAQRAAATQTLDRFLRFLSDVGAAGFPNALEKFNAEQAIDEYGQALGAPPTVIVPDEIIEQNRAARAQVQQLEAQMNVAAQGANVAKMLSDAKTDDQNLLTELQENV